MLFNGEANVIYAIWTLNPASKKGTSWEYADHYSKYSKDCNEYNHECTVAPRAAGAVLLSSIICRSHVLTCYKTEGIYYTWNTPSDAFLCKK